MDDLEDKDSGVFPHPLDEVFMWLSDMDFAVLGHRFAPHGRDYQVLVQATLATDPGTHVLTFTHCVELRYETRVHDLVWPRSWTDEFTDYTRWQEAGEPEGYVWGTDWSNAYPGMAAVPDSRSAIDWSESLGKPMFEATLETDRFFLRLVFHSITSRKISESTETISKVIQLIDW